MIMTGECGGRDRRMLAAAAAAWAASLAAHRMFDLMMDGGRAARTPDGPAADAAPAGMAAADAAAFSNTAAPRDAMAATGTVVPASPAVPAGTIAHVDGAATAANAAVSMDSAVPADTVATVGGVTASMPPVATALALVVGMAVAMAAVAALMRRRRAPASACGRARVLAVAASTLTVPICAALMAGTAAWCADAAAWRDPAAVHARDGPATVDATLRVADPVVASAVRGSDCQAEARMLALDADGATLPSTAAVRVLADGAACPALVRGATMRASGTLRTSAFDDGGVWLVIGDAPPRIIREPGPAARTVAAMHAAFFEACSGLSDQGRALVPGLTLGVLGQDHVAMRDGSAVAVDAAYGAQLERRFRQSGIMHLMAVSGGHFALVAALIRRLCAWALAPRGVVAAATALGYAALAALVYPSDSVLRAVVMGLFGIAARAVGRRPQAMSALCWTVVVVLAVRPAMSRSFGFALSCAAVFGITAFGPAIGGMLGRALPRAVAEAVGVSVSAQLCTLPVQVLMDPRIPLMSVPANLVVAPVVGLSTLAGLAALLASPLSVELGAALAWLAGCGTHVMDRCAAWLADDGHATLPWADGVPGAMLVLAVEACACVAVAAGARLLVRPADPVGPLDPAESGGTPVAPVGERWHRWDGWRARAALWWRQTPDAFGSWAGPGRGAPGDGGGRDGPR